MSPSGVVALLICDEHSTEIGVTTHVEARGAGMDTIARGFLAKAGRKSQCEHPLRHRRGAGNGADQRFAAHARPRAASTAGGLSTYASFGLRGGCGLRRPTGAAGSGQSAAPAARAYDRILACRSNTGVERMSSSASVLSCKSASCLRTVRPDPIMNPAVAPLKTRR